MKFIIFAMILSFNVSASPVLDQVQQDLLSNFSSNSSNGNNGNNGNGNNGHHHGGGNSGNGNGNGGNTGTTPPPPSVNTVVEPNMIALFGIALLGMVFVLRKGNS